MFGRTVFITLVQNLEAAVVLPENDAEPTPAGTADSDP
jgi:hypothetical protein